MKSNSSLPEQSSSGSDIAYTNVERILFGMIPLHDLDWAADQKPAVMQLFLECWRSDPYGTRWVHLSTKLKKTAFTEAKKKLSDQGLFVFKTDSSIQDSRRTVCWMVRNLHGSRIKGFWKEFADTNLETASANLEFADTNLETASANLEFADTNCISPQTLTQSGVQERSISFQYYFNIFSRSLSVAERENFENFVREEWKKKTTKPGQLGEEIISLERFLGKEEDCRNWYALFLASPAGKEAKKQAIAAQYNWENDPRFEEWLNRAFYDGYAWAQENEAEREQRIAFLEWAQATDPYQGRLY